MFFPNVRKDIARYIVIEEAYSFRRKLDLFLFNYSLLAILTYRFGRWARFSCRLPLIKQFCKIISRPIHAWMELLTGIQIPFETKIGPGLYIGHTGMLVLNSETVIGANCNIGVGVVIGQGGRGIEKGSPTIGNGVYVGVGAKILGKVTIGDFVAIGANAVVIHHVPANVTVAGMPAKIVNSLGSKDFVKPILL